MPRYKQAQTVFSVKIYAHKNQTRTTIPKPIITMLESLPQVEGEFKLTKEEIVFTVNNSK